MNVYHDIDLHTCIHYIFDCIPQVKAFMFTMQGLNTFCAKLLKQIKGCFHDITKIFLLVGSYNMLSWQLIKEVLTVYINTLTSKHNWICLTSYSYVVDKIYAQMVQGLADYAQKLTYYATWPFTDFIVKIQLLAMPNFSHTLLLFVPQFISSAGNLIQR